MLFSVPVISTRRSPSLAVVPVFTTNSALVLIAVLVRPRPVAVTALESMISSLNGESEDKLRKLKANSRHKKK